MSLLTSLDANESRLCFFSSGSIIEIDKSFRGFRNKGIPWFKFKASQRLLKNNYSFILS